MGSPRIAAGSTALLKDTARARRRSDGGSPAAMAGQAGIGMRPHRFTEALTE
jgi:hypothetical protein